MKIKIGRSIKENQYDYSSFVKNLPEKLKELSYLDRHHWSFSGAEEKTFLYTMLTPLKDDKEVDDHQIALIKEDLMTIFLDLGCELKEKLNKEDEYIYLEGRAPSGEYVFVRERYAKNLYGESELQIWISIYLNK